MMDERPTEEVVCMDCRTTFLYEETVPDDMSSGRLCLDCQTIRQSNDEEPGDNDPDGFQRTDNDYDGEDDIDAAMPTIRGDQSAMRQAVEVAKSAAVSMPPFDPSKAVDKPVVPQELPDAVHKPVKVAGGAGNGAGKPAKATKTKSVTDETVTTSTPPGASEPSKKAAGKPTAKKKDPFKFEGPTFKSVEPDGSSSLKITLSKGTVFVIVSGEGGGREKAEKNRQALLQAFSNALGYISWLERE